MRKLRDIALARRLDIDGYSCPLYLKSVIDRINEDWHGDGDGIAFFMRSLKTMLLKSSKSRKGFENLVYFLKSVDEDCLNFNVCSYEFFVATYMDHLESFLSKVDGELAYKESIELDKVSVKCERANRRRI